MSVGPLAKDQETYYLSEVIEGREMACSGDPLRSGTTVRA